MAATGRDAMPDHSSLQTYTLRYNKSKRLTLHAMARHWEEARLDATFQPSVTTVTASSNVLAFEVYAHAHSCAINSIIFSIPPALAATGRIVFSRAHAEAPFILAHSEPLAPWCGTAVSEMRKIHGVQGPIDDVFMAPFMVVAPDTPSRGGTGRQACNIYC